MPKGFFWILLRRPSLWAVGMANFGLDFINFMFLTWYPTYLTDTYHMSLGRMGVMAMEPYLLRRRRGAGRRPAGAGDVPMAAWIPSRRGGS